MGGRIAKYVAPTKRIKIGRSFYLWVAAWEVNELGQYK